MPDEKNPVTTETNPETDNTAYIEALAEMRRTTVSRDDYTRLQEENKKLLKSLINGETIEATETEGPSIADLRKDLYGSGHENLSDLEGWTKTLQLREQLIANGERDPFLPNAKSYVPNAEDVEAANRVAKLVKECIEYADGDNSVFVNELNRIMVDARPAGRK